jgi:lipopolysaccharide export system permease protein
MMLFSLLDQLGSSARAYKLPEIMWFVLLTTPRSAYVVFPISALLGALIGVGGLAAMNELVAFRTAGVSRLRIAGSALGAALLVTLPVVLMGEWLAPAAEAQARAFKQRQLVGQVLVGGPTGLWIREGSDFVNIQRPLLAAESGERTVDFLDVVVYSFGDDAKLQEITRARSATHDGDKWLLDEVNRMEIREAGVQLDDRPQVSWDSDLKPEVLDAAVMRPRYMSVRLLLDQIEYLGKNGLDDRVYRSAFWAKVFYPASVIALVLAGMPFVFGSRRQSSLGVRIFIGMSLGGLFMIVNRAVQNMGDAYLLPSAITTVTPSLILAAAVILILRRSV